MLKVFAIVMEEARLESKRSRCDQLSYDPNHKGEITTPVLLASTDGINPPQKSVQGSLEYSSAHEDILS